jgi:hypothetical protein
MERQHQALEVGSKPHQSPSQYVRRPYQGPGNRHLVDVVIWLNNAPIISQLLLVCPLR